MVKIFFNLTWLFLQIGRLENISRKQPYAPDIQH